MLSIMISELDLRTSMNNMEIQVVNLIAIDSSDGVDVSVRRCVDGRHDETRSKKCVKFG